MIFCKRDFIQTNQDQDAAPNCETNSQLFSGRPLEGTPYRNIYNVYKDFVWKKHFIGGNVVIDKLIIMMEKVRGRQIVRREPPV